MPFVESADLAVVEKAQPGELTEVILPAAEASERSIMA